MEMNNGGEFNLESLCLESTIEGLFNMDNPTTSSSELSAAMSDSFETSSSIDPLTGSESDQQPVEHNKISASNSPGIPSEYDSDNNDDEMIEFSGKELAYLQGMDTDEEEGEVDQSVGAPVKDLPGINLVELAKSLEQKKKVAIASKTIVAAGINIEKLRQKIKQKKPKAPRPPLLQAELECQKKTAVKSKAQKQVKEGQKIPAKPGPTITTPSDTNKTGNNESVSQTVMQVNTRTNIASQNKKPVDQTCAIESNANVSSKLEPQPNNDTNAISTSVTTNDKLKSIIDCKTSFPPTNDEKTAQTCPVIHVPSANATEITSAIVLGTKTDAMTAEDNQQHFLENIEKVSDKNNANDNKSSKSSKSRRSSRSSSSHSSKSESSQSSKSSTKSKPLENSDTKQQTEKTKTENMNAADTITKESKSETTKPEAHKEKSRRSSKDTKTKGNKSETLNADMKLDDKTVKQNTNEILCSEVKHSSKSRRSSKDTMTKPDKTEKSKSNSKHGDKTPRPDLVIKEIPLEPVTQELLLHDEVPKQSDDRKGKVSDDVFMEILPVLDKAAKSGSSDQSAMHKPSGSSSKHRSSKHSSSKEKSKESSSKHTSSKKSSKEKSSIYKDSSSKPRSSQDHSKIDTKDTSEVLVDTSASNSQTSVTQTASIVISNAVATNVQPGAEMMADVSKTLSSTDNSMPTSIDHKSHHKSAKHPESSRRSSKDSKSSHSSKHDKHKLSSSKKRKHSEDQSTNEPPQKQTKTSSSEQSYQSNPELCATPVDEPGLEIDEETAGIYLDVLAKIEESIQLETALMEELSDEEELAETLVDHSAAKFPEPQVVECPESTIKEKQVAAPAVTDNREVVDMDVEEEPEKEMGKSEAERMREESKKIAENIQKILEMSMGKKEKEKPKDTKRKEKKPVEIPLVRKEAEKPVKLPKILEEILPKRIETEPISDDDRMFENVLQTTMKESSRSMEVQNLTSGNSRESVPCRTDIDMDSTTDMTANESFEDTVNEGGENDGDGMEFDEDNKDDGLYHSDSDFEFNDDMVDALLEEEVEKSKAAKLKEGEFICRSKLVLDEKGTDPFDILPQGWVMAFHNCGMPVYLHKPTRVVTLTRPYFLGAGSCRRHAIPISAVPCLQYRREMEKETAKQAANDPSNQTATATQAASVDGSGDVAGDTGTDTPSVAGEACETVVKSEPGTNIFENGELVPMPEVIKSEEVEKLVYIEPDEMLDYCKQLFKFKTLSIKRFKTWREKRAHLVEEKRKKNVTRMSAETKLITCQIPEDKNSTGNQRAKKKEFILNPEGKTPVCILHEYAQSVLRSQPSYVFREIENAETPFTATVYINNIQYGTGLAAGKKQAKSEAAKRTLEVFMPTLSTEWKDGKSKGGIKPSDQPDESLQFFEEVTIEDPRVTDLCDKASLKKPFNILQECLNRNFGLGDTELHMEKKMISNQKTEYKMTVGKHTATVVCRNKREAKQRAAQSMLQKLHPHLNSWAGIMRLYRQPAIHNFVQTPKDSAIFDKQKSQKILDNLKTAMLEMRKKRDETRGIKPAPSTSTLNLG